MTPLDGLAAGFTVGNQAMGNAPGVEKDKTPVWISLGRVDQRLEELHTTLSNLYDRLQSVRMIEPTTVAPSEENKFDGPVRIINRIETHVRKIDELQSIAHHVISELEI